MWDQYALRIDRIFAAVDAVRDASGNIVCRVSFSPAAPRLPGCQPLNLFGRGNAAAGGGRLRARQRSGRADQHPALFRQPRLTGEHAQLHHVRAKRNITTFDQHLAEVSARGELFDGWAPARSRWRSAPRTARDDLPGGAGPANQQSNHDGAAIPVPCTRRHALGLRGVKPADCNNTVAHQFSKVSNIQGKPR